MMYPRLETTGRLARKAIASEPLLEHGLAVAVAFADVTAMKTALESRAPLTPQRPASAPF